MKPEFIIILALTIIIVALFLVWLAKTKYFKKICKKANGFCSATLSQEGASKNEIIIRDIESLILKDSNGYELTLARPNTTQLSERKYREICVRGSSLMTQVTQGAMPILAQAQTLSEIAKAAPNGLFAATAPVKSLMNYADGTVGSIVMKNGKIVAHKGFAEVAVKATNPVALVGAGMQAMAAISGQYYMHEISAQLKGVDHKLDKLIGYHHDEKIGILKSINRELCELTAKTIVDATDIISCQGMGKQCGEVYYEYSTRLESANVDAKERWLNKAKELAELGESIDENELNFSIQMCYQASMLYEKCKLAELAVRMKIGTGQEGYITEQVETLQKNSNEAFHRHIQQHIEDYYAPIMAKADEIVDANKKIIEKEQSLNKGILPNIIPATNLALLVRRLMYKAPDKERNIQRRKEVILENLIEDKTEINLVDKLSEPKEILVLLGETPDSQRVFVLDEVE